ncbi:MAG: hypothetical protein LRS46_01545 [Desulfurococcales archaeon]|nr:hypothetical protein [Desulfurococcales archaeon]
MKRLVEKPVFNLLSDVTHYSSVAVDLALYTLASNDVEAAREVLMIERTIDDYLSEIIAGISLAVRGPSQAGLAIGAVTLAEALDKISDAAADLAGLTLRGLGIHKFVAAASVCCDEIVALVRVRRKPETIRSAVDVLLARKGSEYILAPELDKAVDSDVLVVRGPLEEVEELARTLGDSIYPQLSKGTSALVSAIAGDELSSAILQLKSLARLMLDLAFHSLLYSDKSTAREVLRLEDEADELYIRGLSAAFAAGNPSASDEMVSIAVFMKSMESLADAATLIAGLVTNDMVSELLIETVEEAEEAYVKLLVTEDLAGRSIGELRLEDKGILPVAIRTGSTLILPVPRAYRLNAGDVIIVKYYQGSAVDVLKSLEERGFRVILPGSPEK